MRDRIDADEPVKTTVKGEWKGRIELGEDKGNETEPQAYKKHHLAKTIKAEQKRT
jgi:hypothetical protein